MSVRKTLVIEARDAATATMGLHVLRALVGIEVDLLAERTDKRASPVRNLH